MTRRSKKDRSKKCPKKRPPSFAAKTGPKPESFREHENALESKSVFIAKVK